MELEVILTSYYLKAQNPQYVVLLEDWRRVVLNMDMSIAPFTLRLETNWPNETGIYAAAPNFVLHDTAAFMSQMLKLHADMSDEENIQICKKLGIGL